MKNRWSLLVPILVLAACQSATTGPTASGAAGAASAAAAVSAVPSFAATRDPCTVVSRKDVEGLIGTLTAEPAKASSPLSTVPATACAFTSATAVVTIAVADRTMSRSDFDGTMKNVPSAQPESGIGDTAFSAAAAAPSGAGDAATVFGLKGSTFFTVQVASRGGGNALDLARQLAKRVVSGL